ncbi:DUF1449 family protein, partial [Proteus mirabilis]|uniref:OB-fold-containig protein n=1 Tax=Proteus mirabilis TaxID=584 RepID=UPI00254CAD96
LPDSLTETAHAEVGLDAADAGVFVRFLSWLYVGRVPVLMLMVVFLAVYGLTGYLFQTTFAAKQFGRYALEKLLQSWPSEALLPVGI